MNILIQRMFQNRGYTDGYYQSIDDPSYGKLHNIDELAVRLKAIHDSGKHLVIYPDFDMDGIASGTLGLAGFAELGFHVSLFIPDAKRGYGIGVDSIKDCLRQFPDVAAIITCDTGISAVVAAEICHEHGVEFLVTDHHVQTVALPADVIVNPMQFREEYAHPGICGAFVLYQVLQHYADLYCNYFQQDQIRRLRLFAGIGTISDSMPMLYENRQVVRDAVGISKMLYGNGSAFSVANIPGCNPYKLAFWGLYHMLVMCTEKGYLKDGADSIDEEFFGYYFSPMFNSVKRMGEDMTKAFGVFFKDDSIALASELYDLNLMRREATQREYDAILARPQPYAPYIYISSAGSGMLGLIAGKLMSDTGLPVFVANDDGPDAPGQRFHGSGRCPEWFSAQESIGNLISISGHKNAFGFGCNSETSLKRAFTVLCHDVPEAQKAAGVEEVTPDFVIATDLSGDIGIDIPVFQEYITELDSYRPFGVGFPKPLGLLKFRGMDVEKTMRIGGAKQHLKLLLPNGFEVLCWNQGSFASGLRDSDVCYVDGDLGCSEYRGRYTVNFSGVIRKEGD